MTDVTELLRELQDAVKTLDERYQVVAFQELLKHRLSPSSESEPRPSRATQRSTEHESQLPGHEQWQADVVNGLPEAHLAARAGRQAQTVWAVVTLFSQGEPVTTNAVRSTIRTKLGVNPESRGNTSTRLGKLVPHYLQREAEGREYRYEPTRHALQVFEAPEE